MFTTPLRDLPSPATIKAISHPGQAATEPTTPISNTNADTGVRATQPIGL